MHAKAEVRKLNPKRAENSFTTGSIPKALMVFSGPFMLGVLVQNLYGAVDLFVVGHFATTADVSAVTIGSQLMNIATQLIIGFATGITMLVGRYFGAQNKKGLANVVGTSVLLFGGAAAVLTAVYIGFYRQLVQVMQTPQQAEQATRQYLLVCSIGIVFIVGYNVISSILTGLGNSKTPFLFILVACVINIVFDVVLVKYVHLGALGAAIATTGAQAGSFVFSLVYLWRKGLGFAFGKADVRLNKKENKRLAKIGGPVAVQNVLVGVSFLFITAIINQMGLAASAAVGVVEKLITFLFVPAIAMGTAVGTASAQNIGAGQPQRAQKSMWWGILLALIPSVCIALYCQFGGQWLAAVLAKETEVIALAAQYLRSYIIDVVMVSFVFCMNGYFNSCGQSWFSLVHSLVTTFAVRIPLAFWFSRLPGASLYTIGWAAPLSTLASFLLCIFFLGRLKQRANKPA